APPPTITTSVSLLATFQSAIVCKDKRRLRGGAYDDRPFGWRFLWCNPAAIRMRGSARTLRRSTHDLVLRNRRWRRRSRDSRHASIMNKRPAPNQIEGSVVMDVGTALFAKRRYDRRGGEARAGLSHE